MTIMDLNDAPAQREGDLIPNGTICPVQMNVRPGGFGPAGFLKRTKDGSGLMLDAEFVVLEGPHAKRKFWGMYMMEGNGSEGHKTAVDIARATLRAILESARGIRPDDMSDSAKEARRVTGYNDFDGVRFVAKIGVEKSEGYKDKNKLAEAVTPDKPTWAKIEQIAKQQAFGGTASTGAVAAAAASGAAASKPAWAS